MRYACSKHSKLFTMQKSKIQTTTVTGADVINFSNEYPADVFLEISEPDFKELEKSLTVFHLARASTKTRIYHDPIMGVMYAVVAKKRFKYIRVVTLADMDFLNIRLTGSKSANGFYIYDKTEFENLIPGINVDAAKRAIELKKTLPQLADIEAANGGINVRVEIMVSSKEEASVLYHVLTPLGLDNWSVKGLAF